MEQEHQGAVLPFGTRHPNSGWTGSETSQQRAERDDSDGTTGIRQAQMSNALRLAGPRGLTWKEADTFLGWNHHGRTSGALSALHKVAAISRLAEVRNRCKVYVLPEFINGRAVEAPGRTTVIKVVEDLADALDAVLRQRPCSHTIARDPDCPRCQASEALDRYDAYREGGR